MLGEGVEEGVQLLGVQLPQLSRDVRVEFPASREQLQVAAKIQFEAATCSEGFVICFLEVPLACLGGIATPV